MKNSTFYLLAALILGSRIAPKPIAAIIMVGMLVMAVIAEGHGA